MMVKYYNRKEHGYKRGLGDIVLSLAGFSLVGAVVLSSVIAFFAYVPNQIIASLIIFVLILLVSTVVGAGVMLGIVPGVKKWIKG